MRRLFFANWKMLLADDAAEALARTYAARAAGASVDVALAPGFTALERIGRVLAGSPVTLGAQDAFWESAGAYTGEVSPAQLSALGVRFVIVGHSERRAMGEDDAVVARKSTAVAAAGMTPVLCVGELREERETGRQEETVRRQLEAVIGGTWSGPWPIVAYEPRWAIGTGVPCRPEDVSAMLAVIRAAAGADTRILYGGSVDPKNFRSYLDLAGIHGLLVGGASARPDDVNAFFDAL